MLRFNRAGSWILHLSKKCTSMRTIVKRCWNSTFLQIIYTHITYLGILYQIYTWLFLPILIHCVTYVIVYLLYFGIFKKHLLSSCVVMISIPLIGQWYNQYFIFLVWCLDDSVYDMHMSVELSLHILFKCYIQRHIYTNRNYQPNLFKHHMDTQVIFSDVPYEANQQLVFILLSQYEENA